MFYQDFDAAIKNASGKKNFAQRATTAFNMAAKTFGMIGVCSLTLFGIGISSMSGTSTILLAATSIIASASSWGLSHFSSAYAKEVNYEIKYFNEKKALQEMFKENENTLQKRYQRRRHIAFLKEEFKKTKLIGNEGMEETLQKSNKAKEIAIAISTNSEILRTGCASRHKKAEKLLKARKRFWNSHQKE
ncbi:MAG: hypothetical protein J6Y03_05540 [Alphaproteobacteria bacterium]|nr:hypothetical protein [Alphaproteobacteria bacterium]